MRKSIYTLLYFLLPFVSLHAQELQKPIYQHKGIWKYTDVRAEFGVLRGTFVPGKRAELQRINAEVGEGYYIRGSFSYRMQNGTDLVGVYLEQNYMHPVTDFSEFSFASMNEMQFGLVFRLGNGHLLPTRHMLSTVFSFGAIRQECFYDETMPSPLPDARWGMAVGMGEMYSYRVHGSVALGLRPFFNVAYYFGDAKQGAYTTPTMTMTFGIGLSI